MLAGHGESDDECDSDDDSEAPSAASWNRIAHFLERAFWIVQNLRVHFALVLAINMAVDQQKCDTTRRNKRDQRDVVVNTVVVTGALVGKEYVGKKVSDGDGNLEEQHRPHDRVALAWGAGEHFVLFSTKRGPDVEYCTKQREGEPQGWTGEH